jgi:hypothetical protein
MRGNTSMGGTPLAGAIDLAGQTAGQRGGTVRVVVLTDGEETCGGDPVGTAARWLRAGVDVQFNVIGYVVDPHVRDGLGRIATAGGGRYLDARNADELSSALHSAATEPVYAAPPPPPPMQPHPGPPPPQWQPAHPSMRVDPGQGTGTAALVLGLIGLFVFGVVLGVIAIVLGSVSSGQSKRAGFPRRGTATAGVVLGIIDVVGWALLLIVLLNEGGF